MKQTAVEWLQEQLIPEYGNFPNAIVSLFEQAKTMEKEQIIDAYMYDRIMLQITAEQYYKETFKSDQVKHNTVRVPPHFNKHL